MPAYFQLLTALLLVLNSCTDDRSLTNTNEIPSLTTSPKTIRQIPLPAGFEYVKSGDTVYSNWLLDLSLKENKTVYLYNGKLKSDQNVQYGVLDIDIGKKDLVQCADAVMKLRADFLFAKKRYNEMNFIATSGDSLSFSKWLKGMRWKEKGTGLITYKTHSDGSNIISDYNSFMELVFSYCGTYSLSKQLKPVADVNSIQPGDIFITGGFPGHAVTVISVARNSKGDKIFMLSQGYMPAQDIHVLKNYSNPGISPWYSSKELYPLYTPQWQFESGSLKRW